MTFFPFSHTSLFLGCGQDWKQEIQVHLQESLTCNFLFKCVTTTTGVNSAHLNILESAGTKPLHVMRDVNYQGEVVTGGKNMHGTSSNGKSKQMKKKEGVNFLSLFLFLLLRQNTYSLNWACGSGVGLKRGTLFNGLFACYTVRSLHPVIWCKGIVQQE